MPAFSTQSFASALLACLPPDFNGRFCVAYSGGLDSTVLLHALVTLRVENPTWQIRTLHIDHQLQPQSHDWAEHCARVAAHLSVELKIECVSVARDDKEGVEAAARRARYAALSRNLFAGEVLLTAHHADDQAETMLLALMRGSGVQGLASMPERKPFGPGWHIRPLLSFTRTDIEEWSRERGVEGLNDPTNVLRRHDRNFLRHEVLPVFQQRWPALADSIARSTRHLGAALEILEEVALDDLRACAVAECLRIDALWKLSASRRQNLLRYWLRRRGFTLPSTRKLSGLERDLLNADADRMPCVKWPGVDLRWHRGLLYADPARAEWDGRQVDNWEWQSALQLPAQLGSLTFVPTEGAGLAAKRLPHRLTIRFRSGQEKIRLAGRSHRHTLRNLLQQSSVLPWWRDCIPLIYDDRQLLAVGDLFLSAECLAPPGEPALRIVWANAPAWKAVSANRE